MIVFAEGATPDTLAFGRVLAAVLMDSGWNAKVWTALASQSVIRGVLVQTFAGAVGKKGAAADALVSALHRQNIAATRFEQFATLAADGIPASGVSGAPWDVSKVAPIRKLVGSKP